MAEATVYPCPQCGATLALDPGTGKLVCEFCDGSYTIEEIEALVDQNSSSRKEANKEDAKEKKKQRRKRGEEEFSDAPTEIPVHTMEEWDQILSEGTQAHMENVVGYTCHNCGAEVVTDPLTVATSCQYCGSNVSVDQRLTGALKPDYVIPFKIKADDLADRLQEFYSKRPLLPKNFFRENQVGEVQGLYVPFWFYGGKVEGEGHYTSHHIRTYTSGDDQITETTRYSSDREGYVEFKNVPVDASERIDDDLMDSIEPFDYSDLKPFKGSYLTGFVAERFDQNPRQVFERAGLRMKNTTRSSFKATIPGDGIDSEKTNFDFTDATASYVMLPVYLFNCKYNGKHYRYAVNGQTGKIVGEVPTGKRESFMEWLKGLAFGTVGGAIVAAILGFLVFMD